MSESTTESNKIKAIGKSIKKWNSDHQIVTNAPTVFAVLFFLGYLYLILHRLSEHNFEYLKACTKKDDTKYIDLFIIEPCLCYDVACGFFFLFLLIDFGQKLIKRYKITNNQFVFLLVLELSYYVVRGQSWNDYTLTHFKLWTSLYYADVIWLFGLYLIFFKWLMRGIQTLIKCLSDTLVAKKEKLTYKSPISNATPENILTENNNQGFQQSVNTDTSPSINKGIKGLLYDKKINEDNFQRKSFAEQLANRILATNNPEGSVAVAITGEWASGKSTFLGYIKEYLEGKAIIIDMNPGATESKRLLVKDFFDTIAEELQSYDAAVSELVYDYVDSLLEVHENGIIKVLKKVFAFNKTNSTKERFKTLSGCIKQLHQPLIIFIDDLDRLDKKETKEVLRLIRNTANFSRVIYIVAFDKEYVIAQIKTDHDETGKYLDKLFQLEVSLPFYESNKITDYLFKVLEERFGEWHRDDIRLLESEISLRDFVENHRDVNRLINSFSVIYDCYKIGNVLNVDFCDLFLLEIIRTKDFDMYKKIFLQGGVRGYLSDNQVVVKYSHVFDFWKESLEKYYRNNRLNNPKYFDQYFKFQVTEDLRLQKKFLEIVNKFTDFKSEALQTIKDYESEEFRQFIHFLHNLVCYSNDRYLNINEVEVIFYLFQHYYNEEIGIGTLLGLDDCKMDWYIAKLFEAIFKRKEYKQLIADAGERLGDLLISFIGNELNESRNPSSYWVYVILLREKKYVIDERFLSISKSYVKFLSETSFITLEKSWLNIEKIIENCERISFTRELESYALSNRVNMQFLIKQLFKSSDEQSGSLLLNIKTIEKIWGSEQELKDSITHKMLPRATNDIKSILRSLLLMLDDTNPITRSALQEKYWTDLHFLVEYLPPAYE